MEGRTRITSENIEQLLKHFNSYCKPFLRAAYEMGYEVELYDGYRVASISDGKRRELFMGAQTPLNGTAAGYISDRKDIHNYLLAAANIPVPENVVLQASAGDTHEKILESGLAYPVVMKPASGTIGGMDVYIDINSDEEAKAVYRELRDHQHNRILVEQSYSGLNEYRILVLDERVLAVTYKKPGYIIGDGTHTVQELIEQKNQARKELANQIQLSPIPMNAETDKMLTKAGIALDDVVEAGVEVQLQRIGNAGKGGEMIDATDDISDSIKEMCVEVLKTVGLRYAGVDLLCEDIAGDREGQRMAVIETNHYPGITCHMYPQVGTPRFVAQDVIQAVFDGPA